MTRDMNPRSSDTTKRKGTDEPIPEVTVEIDDAVREFLRKGAAATSHPAKLIVLSDFLRNVFKVDIDNLLQGIEKKVGSKVFGVKGSIDLLHQGTVVEIKKDFDREIQDAKLELKKYFQSLLENHPDHHYVGLVTDLIRYELYLPKIDGFNVSDVTKLDEIDTRLKTSKEIILWLDSVLISGQLGVPSADDLSARFGPKSPSFALAVAELDNLWKKIRKSEEAQLKLRLWSRSMEIVYGKVPPEESFITQTYLSLIVKLMVFLRLKEGTGLHRTDIHRVLTGQYFQDRGLTNLTEEDFYSWILDESISSEAEDIAARLVHALATYQIAQADDDLFKELYQKIVGIAQRHGTGEYYTPRWLCDYTLDRLLLPEWGESPPRLLDPACGSGSFLTIAIHRWKDILKVKPKVDQLEEILSSIVGLDVNPLAVTIARANYVIALGDLVRSGKRVTIPIYLADSIKLPLIAASIHGTVYDLVADGQHLRLPKTVFRDPTKRAFALNALREATQQYQDERLTKKETAAFYRRLTEKNFTDGELNTMEETLAQLLNMIDGHNDSIWIFILNNMYAPVMLKEKPFDILVGNPPWIVMRSLENDEYQEFLKGQVFALNLLDKDEIKLYTHMEMATLFFCKTAELYLRQGGKIGFVMPISVITGAFHHANFNKFANPVMKLEEVSSFRDVPGIFSLPPCVMLAKKGESTTFPVPLLEFNGSLNGLIRNAALKEVMPRLSRTESRYTPAAKPTSRSFYFDLFREGATLVPHNLWYVEADHSVAIDTDRPLVKSSEDIARVAKRPWKELRLKSPIEAQFLYASYLGKDIVPFGTLPPRPVILPMVNKGHKRILLDVNELRGKGFPFMANWVHKAQSMWEYHRTAKSKNNFPRILDRLDHNGLLTGQDPTKRFIVIYNARGADAVSSVVDRTRLPKWKVGDADILLTDFVAESTNYFYLTNDIDEADYLCAVLNAPSVSLAVKPYQPSGLYGKRDIGRRPLMLPISKFDATNEEHRALVELSRKCRTKVANLKFSGTGFRTCRNEATTALKKELVKIDALVDTLGIAIPDYSMIEVPHKGPLETDMDEGE